MADNQTQAVGDQASTLWHEIKDGVMRITLNKPDMANAISPDQRDLIVQLMAEADANYDVRVVVLAATGKFFCSGADVRGIAASRSMPRLAGSTIRTMMNGAQRLIASVLDCGKPVIAAMQGPAAGMGAHLALACDLIVAVDSAWFSQPHVQRGLSLDAGGAYLMPRRVGLQKAKEMAFLGDRLSVAEAKTLGMVNVVCSEAEFPAAVDALAARLAKAATMAISLSKRQLNASLDGDRAAAFLGEAMAQEVGGASLDSQEGVQAFMEKRPPVFKGH